MLTVLDKIKSGEVKVNSIEEAMAAMMDQMGVYESDMTEAIFDIGNIFATKDDDDENN